MIDQSSTSSDAISVSDALGIAKGQLENIVVKVLGEVSELSNKPGYKAVYFTIKDKKSSLPCMMWMNRFNASGIDLKIGSLIEITGRFSLYAAKGRMNFDVFSIDLAGEGKLRLQVAQLAKLLQSEGLMAAERKRRLPMFPARIGVVTSPRGAAIHDVLRTLRRRYPIAEILVAGVPVEGSTAPSALIEGLHCVADAGAEVVLLVRGGGSFEDLMPFNDEALARAICTIPVPVVTGIGHEPDNSISDMVADFRASTPTAAAEAVAPDILEIKGRMDAFGVRMQSSLKNRLESTKIRMDHIASLDIFKDPYRLFSNEAQTLDDLSLRLNAAIPENIRDCRSRIDVASLKLKGMLSGAITFEEVNVSSKREILMKVGKDLCTRFHENVTLNASRLEDLSPLKVISRGYAIVSDGKGEILKGISSVDDGQKIDVTLSDGILRCNVDSKKKMEIDLYDF